MYSGLIPLKIAVIITPIPMTMTSGITHTRFSSRIDMMRVPVEMRKATAPRGYRVRGSFRQGSGRSGGPATEAESDCVG